MFSRSDRSFVERKSGRGINVRVSQALKVSPSFLPCLLCLACTWLQSSIGGRGPSCGERSTLALGQSVKWPRCCCSCVVWGTPDCRTRLPDAMELSEKTSRCIRRRFLPPRTHITSSDNTDTDNSGKRRLRKRSDSARVSRGRDGAKRIDSAERRDCGRRSRLRRRNAVAQQTTQPQQKEANEVHRNPMWQTRHSCFTQ